VLKGLIPKNPFARGSFRAVNENNIPRPSGGVVDSPFWGSFAVLHTPKSDKPRIPCAGVRPRHCGLSASIPRAFRGGAFFLRCDGITRPRQFQNNRFWNRLACIRFMRLSWGGCCIKF
jgi:hypothetical protein